VLNVAGQSIKTTRAGSADAAIGEGRRPGCTASCARRRARRAACSYVCASMRAAQCMSASVFPDPPSPQSSTASPARMPCAPCSESSTPMPEAKRSEDGGGGAEMRASRSRSVSSEKVDIARRRDGLKKKYI
jgi:hypothetical protein